MSDRRSFLRHSAMVAGALGASGIGRAVAGEEDRQRPRRQSELSRRLKRLTAGTAWTLVGQLPLKFKTFHPQGMVKRGDAFYITSVEVTEAPVKYPQPVDGYDRSPGAGQGHVFKVDLHGNLLFDLLVGEGTMYHPGGCDADGDYLWVPAAEYRPNSRGMIYRIHLATMTPTKVLEYPDHLGGCAYSPEDRALHVVNWGSRGFYRFGLDPSLSGSRDARIPPARLMRENPEFYIDYQDNKYLGHGEMLYTGLDAYQVDAGSPVFNLGGLDIVDLDSGLPVHQVPLKLWSPVSKLAMTNNPVEFELTADGLRGYFMPDDNDSVIYVYEAVTG